MNFKPIQIESSWKEKLNTSFQSESFIRLKKFLKSEKEMQIIYPAGNKIFSAFNLCPFNSVKIVIIGQDPYHGNGQAHGLSFSVPNSIKTPPSLRNIKKLLFGVNYNNEKIQNDLTNWATQGVLLLNTVLTVKDKSPYSHQSKGWELFN